MSKHICLGFPSANGRSGITTLRNIENDRSIIASVIAAIESNLGVQKFRYVQSTIIFKSRVFSIWELRYPTILQFFQLEGLRRNISSGF